MTTTTIAIEGMTCGHCLRSVDRALRALPGVTIDQLMIGAATISYDESGMTRERITRAIEDTGYRVLQST